MHYYKYKAGIRHLCTLLFVCCFSSTCGSLTTAAQHIYNKDGDLILNPASFSTNRETYTKEGDLILNPTNLSTRREVFIKPEQLKVKYANYLRISPDSLVNLKMYAFIDRWMHTPYKWGGTGKNGIDCSAFIQRLLDEVYDLRIPRTSIQQLMAKSVEPYKSPAYLSEGDIIFFRTMKNKVVSHVGIYLYNNMFINSSSSKGVSLGSLKDPYWRSRYVAAGRIKAILAKK
jgi:murein DD-endopeptidase / murein LD-carboxypeptidase